jgi:hypothetical protein
MRILRAISPKAALWMLGQMMIQMSNGIRDWRLDLRLRA